MQEEPRGTGDAVRSARAALEGFDGDVLVLNGDVPALTRRDDPRARRDASRGRRRRDRALLRAGGRRAPTAASSATATAGSRGSSRPPTRRRRSSRSARSTPASTSSGREQLWPALERLEPQNAQGELYVTDTLGLLVADGEAVRRPTRSRAVRGRGRQHPRRARRGHRCAPRPDQRARTCSPASRSSTRPSTWIEAGVEIEPDVDDASRSRGRIRGGVRDRRAAPRSGRSPMSAPVTVLGEGAKSGTFVEVKNAAVGAARRSRTSPTSATPRSARGRTSPPATSPPTSRTSPAAEGADDDRRATSGPASTMCSCAGRDRRRRLDCSRVRSSRMMSPRFAGRVRPAPGNEGRMGLRQAWKARRRLSWPSRAWRAAVGERAARRGTGSCGGRRSG